MQRHDNEEELRVEERRREEKRREEKRREEKSSRCDGVQYSDMAPISLVVHQSSRFGSFPLPATTAPSCHPCCSNISN
jgi:hypothetical protein